MAKTSSIEKNKRRAKLAKQYAGRRDRLRKIARDKNATMEERFAVQEERMSAMLSVIVRVAERLDRTPEPPSG